MGILMSGLMALFLFPWSYEASPLVQWPPVPYGYTEYLDGRQGGGETLLDMLPYGELRFEEFTLESPGATAGQSE